MLIRIRYILIDVKILRERQFEGKNNGLSPLGDFPTACTVLRDLVH